MAATRNNFWIRFVFCFLVHFIYPFTEMNLWHFFYQHHLSVVGLREAGPNPCRLQVHGRYTQDRSLMQRIYIYGQLRVDS